MVSWEKKTRLCWGEMLVNGRNEARFVQKSVMLSHVAIVSHLHNEKKV